MSLQFSIRTFVIVITLLAVGFACVVASHPVASNAIYTLNWVLMCLALVGSFVVRGDQRVFWIGFTVFAWCYSFFGIPSSNNATQRAWPGTSLAASWNVTPSETTVPPRPDRLLSEYLTDFIEARVHPRWSIGDAVVAQYNNGSYYPGVVDDFQNGQYLIRWTDGSSSPAQWTVPAQILPGTTTVRVAAQSLICSLWGLFGGFMARVFLCARAPKGTPKNGIVAPVAGAPVTAA